MDLPEADGLPVTPAQQAELERRLATLEQDRRDRLPSASLKGELDPVSTRSEMSPFRISAVILFVAAIVSVGLALANRQSAATGGRDLSGFYTLAVLLTAVGIGLFAHWRPVAAIFIAALISLGAWLGIGSLLDVPFPWALINLLYATLLIAGAVKLIRCWSRLSE